MAATIDTGLGRDISKRPKEKKTIALRLANLALATQYGQPIKCFGPAYDHLSIEGKAIRIYFRRAEPELVAKDGPPQGFEIAGGDKVFHWADARIDGDSIIVSCKQVAKPIAVRYAWADNPKCNIFSADDIPLMPFRTDDWLHRKPEPASGKAPAGNS
jgi:sialate O-acetylesterase